MGSWATESTNAGGISTGSYTDTLSSTRSGARSGVSNSTNGSYSVIGINGIKALQAKEKIDEYVKAIQVFLDDIEETANTSNAFKGSYITKEVQQYILKVKEYGKNLASGLLAFSDKLEEVNAAWVKASQVMGENINASASSSAGFNTTAYQHQHTSAGTIGGEV